MNVTLRVNIHNLLIAIYAMAQIQMVLNGKIILKHQNLYANMIMYRCLVIVLLKKEYGMRIAPEVVVVVSVNLSKGKRKKRNARIFFFRDPARTVDVMAVGRACARADRAPASFTSAAMVCRSPGGSAAMVSAVHAVTPGVRPVTPPGCSMVSGAPTQRGTSLAPDAVVPSGFSTGRLVPPRGTRRPPQAARAMMPRVSAAARTRATPPPPSPAPRRVRAPRRGG